MDVDPCFYKKPRVLLNSRYYHCSSDELIEMLCSRDMEIVELQRELSDLLRTVNHEYAVSKNMMDQNIEMKGMIHDLQQRLQVHAHPSTIKELSEALRAKVDSMEQFRSMLTYAISKIESNAKNHSDIQFLQHFLQKNQD